MQNYLLAYVMFRNGNRQRLEFSVAEVILISAVPRCDESRKRSLNQLLVSGVSFAVPVKARETKKQCSVC